MIETHPLQTFSESEVAELLKLSVAGARKLRREGRGPRYTRVGRLIRYRWSAVQEWLDLNTPEAAGAVAPVVVANPVSPSSQPEATAPIKPNGSDRSATTFDDL